MECEDKGRVKYIYIYIYGAYARMGSLNLWSVRTRAKSFKSLYFDSGDVEAIIRVPLTCYQTIDAMFWSHSKNGFYTIRSNYHVARITAIKETLI